MNKKLNQEDFWNILPEELKLIYAKHIATRLGFAVKLKFYKCHKSLPSNWKEINKNIIKHIAQCLNLASSDLKKYNLKSRTSRKHNEEIRAYFNYKIMTTADVNLIREKLCKHALPLNLTFQELERIFYTTLDDLRLERITPKEIEKYISHWRREYEIDFFSSAANILSDKAKGALDRLLNQEEDLSLYELSLDPNSLSVKNILKEGKKLSFLRENNLAGIYDALPKAMLQKYYEYLLSSTPREIKRYDALKRYVILASFCHIRSLQISDHLIDMFIRLGYKVSKRAKIKVDKDLYKNRKVLYNRAKILKNIALVSLSKPKGTIEDNIYPIAGVEVLEHLANSEDSFDQYHQKQKYSYMASSYTHHYKTMLTFILKTFKFRANSSINKPFLEALALVEGHIDNKATFYPDIEAGKSSTNCIVTKSLKPILFNEGKLNKTNYELTVMMALRAKLICRELWINNSSKYGNIEKDLPADYEILRENYIADLGLPNSIDNFICQIKETLNKALVTLNKTITKNQYVEIINKNNKPWIQVSPIDAKPEPKNIIDLKGQITSLWNVSLLDILKETEFRLNLSAAFCTVASREATEKEELRRRILLCLFSLATNTGLKNIEPDVNELEKLRYTQRRYITKSNIQRAIIKIINGNLKIRDQELFGNARVSLASDATRFNAWDQNLITEHRIRHGGRSIMIYWHVDKKSLCVYSKLKSCSSSEVVSMIEGLLYHNTDAELEKNYVDTKGQSLIGFAFCYLLGFDLLPRIRSIGSEKLFIDTDKSNYDNLKDIIKRPIKWDYIRHNYFTMVEYAVALKNRLNTPEILLKRFVQKSKNTLNLALQELGRVVKTIFLCRYLNSLELRKEIFQALNVVENWNSANKFIFFGKQSIISSNNITSQEISALSLHLMQSSLVYINTLMLQKVLGTKEWNNRLTAEDKKALTPLFYTHINPYGTFDLDMNRRIEI